MAKLTRETVKQWINMLYSIRIPIINKLEPIEVDEAMVVEPGPFTKIAVLARFKFQVSLTTQGIENPTIGQIIDQILAESKPRAENEEAWHKPGSNVIATSLFYKLKIIFLFFQEKS